MTGGRAALSAVVYPFDTAQIPRRMARCALTAYRSARIDSCSSISPQKRINIVLSEQKD